MAIKPAACQLIRSNATSVYAKLWEASGIPYPELLDRLLRLALERHEDEGRYRH